MRFIFLFLGFFACFTINASSNAWEYLNPGDKIAIVATSSMPDQGCLDKAIKLLNEQGFEPLVFVHSNAAEYGRAPVKDRAQDLFYALKSDAKAIWAIRGGRGASRIFRDFSAFEEFSDIPPKLLIGFSDFTAVHLWATSIGWPSLHGIVQSYCAENSHAVNENTSIAHCIGILTGSTKELSYELKPENDSARSCSIESTRVIGGNLSVIQRSLSTKRMPILNSNILFIEDIGEEGSKVSEILGQFLESGILNGVKAVIWGNFESRDTSGIETAKGEFNRDITEMGIPMYSANFFGHGPDNFPLPLNTLAKIEAGVKLVVRTNN